VALDTLSFRPATIADADRLAAVMAEGLATYRSFAPALRAPTAEDIAGELAARLETPPVWCLLAEDASGVAGYVSLLPASASREPVDDPGLAHFWMLFVRAGWWGSGLASRLHAAACDEAAARGYTAMRLFTPADQARARRFYEREGWAVAGEPFVHDELRLAMVEYRRTLPR
jgi:ribosomal protein S18 acetylase RimI-like enzyme